MKDKDKKQRLPDHVIEDLLKQHFIISDEIKPKSQYMKLIVVNTLKHCQQVSQDELLNEIFSLFNLSMAEYDATGFQENKVEILNRFHKYFQKTIKFQIYDFANQKNIVKRTETGRESTILIESYNFEDSSNDIEDDNEPKTKVRQSHKIKPKPYLGDHSLAEAITNPMIQYFMDNKHEILTERQLAIYEIMVMAETNQKAAESFNISRQAIHNTKKAIRNKIEKKFGKMKFQTPESQLMNRIEQFNWKTNNITDKQDYCKYIIDSIRELIDHPLIEEFPDGLILEQKRVLFKFLKYDEQITDIQHIRSGIKYKETNLVLDSKQLDYNQTDISQNLNQIMEIGIIFLNYLNELYEQLQRKQQKKIDKIEKEHFFSAQKG